jgi:DnaK suppressor protein
VEVEEMQPVVSALSDTDVERLRAQLEALRLELDALLENTAEGARPVDLGEPIGRLSRVDAMQQQSMLAANRTAAMRRRQQVDAALRRILDEEYGECASCGEFIDPRRLDAQPEAPMCVACQGLRER